jgi:hypothetical protein
MTTYKITPDSNTFSISLSRTGGQGAKGDSISSVYIDENNELVAEISNSAGDVIKTEQLGSIDTIVAQASTDAIGDLITTGNNYLINVAANDEGSYDFTVEAYQDGTIPSSLVQRTEDGYIRANAFKLEASNIEFHDVVKEGELGWSSERNAMIMGLTDDGKHTYVNQQQVAVVYNPYEALPQGTVVYVEGSYIGDSENFPTVAKASNNQVGTSTAVLGVVMYDIPAAEGPVFHKGYVCTHGIVEYVDTSAYVAGTRVWLGVDGNLVGVEPQTPAARTMIGYVVKQDAIEGSIYVQVQPGFELYELNDVRIYNPQDGDFIAWNASNSQWENINLNLTFASDAELQALNASIQASLANKSDNTHTHLLNDLSDVNISAKTTSFVITYDAVSQKWISRRLNVADITGLQTALDGKSNVGHTHTKSQITDFRDSDYATAAQGILANTAVQPGDNISDLVNDLNYVKNTDVVTQVTEAAVTAHEGALTITEAQISDLQSYSLDTHTHDLGDLSNVHLGALSDRQLIAWNGIDAFANTSPDNLGLVEDTDIGVTVQGYTASLNSMANVPVTADKVLYTTGANTWSSMTVTPFARTLLNDLDAATMRTTIGAEPADATILKDADIGVNVQAYNSFLTGVNATFTNTLLSKLNSVEDGATADQTGAEIKALYENEANTNAFTDDEKTKLSNIEEGATADMTSAEIKAAYEANVDTNAFTDSEKSKLSGIESGATADQTGAEIKALYEAELNTNAFTDAEKSKLAGIESEATADQTGAEIKALYEGELDTNAYTDSEKSKLAGIEEGAQVNVVTSVNNHTGDIILETDDISDNLQNNKWFTQLERNKLSNIENFADQTDFDSVSLSGAVMTSYTSVAGNGWVIDEDDMVSNLDTKVPTQQSVKAYVDARVASSVEYKGSYDAATNTPDLDLSPVGVTTGDMYTVTVAGNFFTIAVEVGDVLIAEVDDPSTAADWTIVNKDLDAASIKTSYESNADTNAYTDAEKAKLAGIEAGATGDQTGQEIKTLYEQQADTNAFTDALLSKLQNIEAGATGDQTATEIKSLYESNANTNAYTDAEQSKLAGIEANATADQTGAEIKSLYEAEANTNAYTDAEKTKLAGIEAGATGDQTPAEILTAIKTVDGAASGLDADLLDGQQGSYYLDYNNATNKPTSIAQLTTARDITLSGVVTGTASFDGSADANITVSSNMSLDNLTNVTETGKATNDYLRWTGLTWEGDHVRAADVSYDNTDSTLESSTVKAALDELDSGKVDVTALNANLVVYPTTTASDITNYYKGVTSTTDTDYNTTAANVSTGSINGTGVLVASVASVSGILTGDPGVVVTSTVARVRRTAGTGTASFYYEMYHRADSGVETLLATSSETDPVNSATYSTYSATAIMSGGTAFTETCRLVIKWFANQKTTSDPTYDIEFGGATPARTTIPVPLSTLATTSTAASVSVDTSNFSGFLFGTDANVQAALEQLDSFQGSTTDVASTLVQRGSDNQFDITGIDFTTTHSLAGGVGRLVWNDTDGTLDLGLKGGNATLQIGQEQVIRVYNGTGASIPNGSALAITGATGGLPSVVLADTNVEDHGHTTLGLATETIANGSAGYMTVIGIVRGLNTSGYTEGDELYLSSTAGGLTTVKPDAVHVIHMGTVVTADGSNGSIYVQPKQPLYDDLWRLEDVTLTSPVAEQFLKYNGSVWVNADIPQINTLDDIGDVTITSATADQFLKWSGSAWVNADIPQINSVGDIADVTITSIGSGELLKWDGAKWVNNTLAEAGIAAAVHTHAAADVTSGTFADARIAQSNVTQHQGALSIGWSQLTGVPTYDNYVSWSFSATDTQVISSGETVSFAGSGSISVSNSGNAITISGTDTTYSAGNGIALSGTTFSVAAGSGLVQDASGLSHADTSTQASVNNSDGTVIQDITLDGFGHITAVGSVNLDGRYYTESEVDTKLGTKSDTTHNHTLDSLSNVTVTSKATKDYLRWNGSAWVNSSLYGKDSVGASSAATTLDMNSEEVIDVTITSNTTLSFSNLSTNVGKSGVIVIRQDASGGRTFVLPSEAKTPLGGASINQVTTANTVSALTYIIISSTEVLVNYIGDFA